MNKRVEQILTGMKKEPGLTLTKNEKGWKVFSFYVSLDKKRHRAKFSFDGDSYSLCIIETGESHVPTTKKESHFFQDNYCEMEKFFSKNGFG